eukprot:g11593.t1
MENESATDEDDECIPPSPPAERPEMLCLNSSSSSNQTKSQGKVQLILPLDQGVILRWFILGSHHNSHALTPREIFMLNDFHIKNTVYLPDGNTVSGKRVYVHTQDFDYVFTKQVIRGHKSTILIQVRSGWRHFYKFLSTERDNIDIVLIHRNIVNNPNWYYSVPSEILPTLCRVLDKENTIFKINPNSAQDSIGTLQEGEVKLKTIFHKKAKGNDMEISSKCNQSVIVDTNLNCWSDSNDASSILPVDDLSKKTPHDSIFLNMIHIMTKLMDRVRSKSAALKTNIPNLINQLLRECYMENLKHTYQKLKNIRLNPSTSMDISVQNLRDKWHIVIDTNVLLCAAKEDFLFFDIIDKNLSASLVLVIPFVVYSELDHLKKGNRAELNTGDAIVRKTINYINIQLANNERNLFVVQTSQENSIIKISPEKKIGTTNDMRIVECARYRRDLGMKVMVVSNDTNLRTLAMSLQIQAFSFIKLSKMVMDPRYVNLVPERWSVYYKSLDEHNLED